MFTIADFQLYRKALGICERRNAELESPGCCQVSFQGGTHGVCDTLQMPVSCLEEFFKIHVLKTFMANKHNPLLSHLHIGLPVLT